MQDFMGSVRRSLVFRPTFGEEGPGDRGGGLGGFVEKINSGIRNSRISLFSKPRVPSPKRDEAPPIRWRKGELIGCGAFGRVYMGMNIDSGELLAVKQVLVATNSASKEKTQAHVRELEDEVKLLKNLSHPNIVRYLGTVREDDSLNILLEFVPGGSISSLLGKFGSFPESVVRMYTKQLLLGLEYLHKNGIMHRDIKGANILVDNKGCIKLADFGASKKVVELATVNGAKSMKGTPYWMAPEVILQTGHNHSADIWSVGCTVIEMATGKPPWSQQYQEVAALFHIGTTKSHPPIPNHLSEEAKDFLLKCLQKEPFLRPTASELLQHPFVTGEYLETHLASQSESGNSTATPGTTHRNSINMIRRSTSRLTCTGLNDVCEVGSMKGSTLNPENLSDRTFHLPANDYDDLCRIDDKDDLCNISSVGFKSGFRSSEIIKSFNPMCEPTDDSPCKFDASPEVKRGGFNLNSSEGAGISPVVSYDNSHFTFPSNQSATEEEDEVTESKIRAFLDEKALDLKRLQTPLYKEFYNTLNGVSSQSALGSENLLNFPPKSRSPKRLSSRRLSAVVDAVDSASPTKGAKPILRPSSIHDRAVQDTQPPQMNQLIEIKKTVNPRASFLEIQRKWKEELDEELERNREKLRRAGVGGKTKSPKDPIKM